MTVTTCSVVRRLNVIEYVGTGYVLGFGDPLAGAFFLQTTEKRLSYGIVPAVSSAVHTRLEVVGQT